MGVLTASPALRERKARRDRPFRGLVPGSRDLAIGYLHFDSLLMNYRGQMKPHPTLSGNLEQGEFFHINREPSRAGGKNCNAFVIYHFSSIICHPRDLG
jgi:hypothetical protein